MASKLAAALEAGNTGLAGGDPPENNEAGGGGDEGSGASLGAIRDRLGISEEELNSLDTTEFTPEELALLGRKPAGKGGAAGDDEGAGEGDGGEDDAGEAGGEAEDEAEGAAEGPPPKGYVSVKALREARSELRAANQRLSQLEQWRGSLADKLLAIRGGQQPGQQQPKKDQQPDEMPDENKDPVGAIAWLKKQLIARNEKEQQEEQERTQQEERTQQQAVYEQRVIDTADEVLTHAVEADPEVQEAFEYASAAIMQELANKGFRGERLQAEFNKVLVKYSESAPADPKAMILYAKRNARYWGWDPGKKFGEQPKPAPKTNQKQPVSRLAQLKKAQETNRSLSGGGMPGGGELSLDDLAEMSGEELEKLAETNPELFEAAARR